MLERTCIVAIAAMAMLCASATDAPAVDDVRPRGAGQQPPLTPEYQKIFEASLAAQAAGGQGNDTTYTCIPAGMPRQATSGFSIEMVVTPSTTYWLYGAAPHLHRRTQLPEQRGADLRRLFDRPMARRQRRQVRHAGRRDPQPERLAPVRQLRRPAAR